MNDGMKLVLVMALLSAVFLMITVAFEPPLNQHSVKVASPK
jgi:hypothetical protein